MKTIITGREARDYISKRYPFATPTRTFRGTVDTNYETGNQVYKVWSYATVIAQYEDGVWYFNHTSYSNTTSRHQGYVAYATYGLADKAVHLYTQRFYITDLPSKVTGKVVRDRIKRIQLEQGIKA